MFEDTNFNEINGKLVDGVIKANQRIGYLQAKIANERLSFVLLIGGIGAGHIIAKYYKDKKEKSESNKSAFQR